MDDVAKFKSWANRLGFPIKDLPNDEKLKSVFKSRQGSLFHNMMEKVRPKQEVREIRRNILISKIKQLEKDKIIPTHMRSHLPKELQRYLKMQDLLKQKEEAEMKFSETKKAYEKTLESLNNKNISKIKLEKEYEELQAKENLLKLKKISLDSQIQKEKDEQEKIRSIIPAKIKQGNENDAYNAIQQCTKELETFYDAYFTDCNSHRLQEAQEMLWKKIRKVISNVPNYYLWMCILRMKEDQLQKMICLNKTITQETEPPNKENIFSLIEMNIMRTQANLIAVHAKSLDAKEQCKELNESFIPAYLKFAESLKFKIDLFDADSEEDIDDIISEYVTQYVSRSSHNAQNEFLAQQIERYKEKISSQKQILKDHHMIQNAVLETYSQIEKIIKQMQQETYQLNQIKDKISYSKNMSNYIFQDLQAARNQASKKAKLTPSSPTSFDFGNSLLCSTKIDMENLTFVNSTINLSPSRIETSMMPTAGQSNVLPQHLDELKIFLEVPTKKFHVISFACFLHLYHNPIITDGESTVATIEIIPEHLLTAEGSIQQVEKCLKGLKEVQNYALELKPNIVIVDAEGAKFREQRIAQHEEVAELLDKIKVIEINNKRLLKKVQKYFQFILDNPLGNYIPSTKIFNNRTFSEYENEFNMYYRIFRNSSSLVEQI